MGWVGTLPVYPTVLVYSMPVGVGVAANKVDRGVGIKESETSSGVVVVIVDFVVVVVVSPSISLLLVVFTVDFVVVGLLLDICMGLYYHR